MRADNKKENFAKRKIEKTCFYIWINKNKSPKLCAILKYFSKIWEHVFWAALFLVKILIRRFNFAQNIALMINEFGEFAIIARTRISEDENVHWR